MKKSVTNIFAMAGALTALVLVTGCVTPSTRNISMNEINSEKMVVNTYFDRDDFVILGTVTGESDYVVVPANSLGATEFVGDSGKYGMIYERSGANLGDKTFIGTGRRIKGRDASEAVYRAKLNANYVLIENADKIGADAIFDPIYTVEMKAIDSTETAIGSFTGGTISAKVTVRAKAIQFKKQ